MISNRSRLGKYWINGILLGNNEMRAEDVVHVGSSGVYDETTIERFV